MEGPGAPPLVSEDILKILVVGAQHSGRSALIRRYTLDLFTSSHVPTIGADLTSHQLDATYESKVDNEIWVHFWNIAYPEVRGKHVAAYLKEANGVIVVFDSTDLKSIQAVDEWRLVIEQHLPTASEGRKPARMANKGLRPVPMILVANKCDVGKPVMKPADLELYIKKCGYQSWVATSAREGTGVKQAFDSLLETAVELLSYKKLEDKCNRKLARENQKKLSSSLSFTTQSLYETAETRRTSHNSSPVSFGDADDVSDGFSSLSTSPNRSEIEFDPESMSLRDLETRGNHFYLDLAARLGVYVNYADKQRQRDLEQLEIKRVTEYAEFKRKFLDVANCVVHFSPSGEVRSTQHSFAEEQSIDTFFPLDTTLEEPEAVPDINQAQAVRLFSEIHVFLIESMRKWKKVIEQLETEIALLFPPDQLPELRFPKTPRSRSPAGSPSESFGGRFSSPSTPSEDDGSFRQRSVLGDGYLRAPKATIRRGFSDDFLPDNQVTTKPRHRSLGFGFRNSKIGKGTGAPPPSPIVE